MKLIAIIVVVMYLISVWGSNIIKDFAGMQKERQDRIEIILKGE